MDAPPSYEDAVLSDDFNVPPYSSDQNLYSAEHDAPLYSADHDAPLYSADHDAPLYLAEYGDASNYNPAYVHNESPSYQRPTSDVIDSSSVLQKALNISTPTSTSTEDICCSTSHIQPPTTAAAVVDVTGSVTSLSPHRTRHNAECRLHPKIPNWMIYLQMFTLLSAFCGMFIAYNKMLNDPGGPNDVMYLPPSPAVMATNSCVYFNGTERGGNPTKLGQLCQWVLADGIVWTIAALSLVMDYLCSEPNKPIERRFGVWWLIIYFGSFFLGASGIAFTAEASRLMQCDILLFVGVAVCAAADLALGVWFWFCVGNKQ